MVAGTSEARVAALAAYGDSLGVAFQIVDDLLDYGGASAAIGKNAGDDFREGKATLPVFVAFSRGDERERAFWRRVIEKREQHPGDLDQALDILRRREALTETMARALEHVDRAKAALDAFPASPLRAAMADMADFVAARAH
jgi:octaprenyl-diphosphate synthase